MAEIRPYFENLDTSLGTGPGLNAEKVLYQEIQKQFRDKNWYVIYNTDFINNEAKENQIDFLVLVPGKGIINLECKGNGYTPDGPDKFRFNGTLKIPLIQSMGAVRNFYRTVQETLFPNTNWTHFARAVIFPLSEFQDQNGQKYDFLNNPIYTRSDLKNGGLVRIVENTLNAIIHRTPNLPCLTQKRARQVFEKFTAAGVEIPVEFAQAPAPTSSLTLFDQGEQAMSLLLTREENRALCFIDKPESVYVHIQGPAGTGKTWIAMAAAQHYAKQKKRVLYVCYNKLLAAYIRRKFKGENALQELSIYNFHKLHGLCFDSFQQGGPLAEYGQRYLEEVAQRGFKKDFRKFDVILVDEAQDLKTDMINFLRALAIPQKNRKFVLFSSTEQTIYEKNWKIENLNFEFPCSSCFLDDNLRNTNQIFAYTAGIVDLSGIYTSEINGYDVEKLSLSRQELNDKILALLDQSVGRKVAILGDDKELLRSLGSEIGPFSLRGYLPQEDNSAQEFNQSQENLRLWLRGEKNRIWISTIHAFKGLEADQVILLLGNPAIQEQEENKLDYIGASRAKLKLTVIQVHA